VDLEEAYLVGCQAVSIALEHGSGYMATILREPGSGYRVRYDKVPLQVVANSERSFPAAWIAPSRTDVTDDFVDYARPLVGSDWPSVPLVGGLQRFTRLKPVFADRVLPAYVPQAHRPRAASTGKEPPCLEECGWSWPSRRWWSQLRPLPPRALARPRCPTTSG
jgi:6-phosphofructokinase 1